MVTVEDKSRGKETRGFRSPPPSRNERASVWQRWQRATNVLTEKAMGRSTAAERISTDRGRRQKTADVSSWERRRQRQERIAVSGLEMCSAVHGDVRCRPSTNPLDSVR